MLQSVFTQILSMSIRGSLVILAVMLVRLALKKAPKIYSYLLWSVVLFRLLCPVSVEAPVSVVPEFPAASVVYLPVENGTVQVDLADGGKVVYGESAPLQQSDPTVAPQPQQSLSLGDYLLIARYVWLAGMFGLAAYSIAVYLKLRFRLTGARQQSKNVYLSEKIPSAFVLGIIRPRIYLPAFIKENEQAYILAHEQHHIRRADHIVKLLGYMTLMLHWFNPLVWLAYILCCKDMEMSCDEAVIKKMGPEIRADYAQSLLNLATGHRAVSVMPLAFGEGDTKGRVKNMSKWKKPKLWICVIAALLIIGVAVVLITDPIGKENTDNPEPTIIRDGPTYIIAGGMQPENAFDIVQSWAGNSSSMLVGGLNAEKMSISSVQHLPIHKFDTRQELESFLDFAKPDQTSGDATPSFYETIKKYDDAFFEDQTLMLVYVTAGSTNHRFRVAEIYCDGMAFVLHLETEPGQVVGDTMQSGWFVTVAVPDAMVSSCSGFDADLDNLSYGYPRVAYSRSEIESSTYTVAVQLPSADKSLLSQEAKQLVAGEWATYDSLSQEEQMYSSHLWGAVDTHAHSWQEAQKILGIPVENPFESTDFLTKRNYLATGNPSEDVPRVKMIVDSLSAADRSIRQIDLYTGYTAEDIRVQLNTTVRFTDGVYSVGAGCGGYATFSQSLAKTASGENVLLVRAEHMNNYSNLEAYWVDGYVLYRIYLVGPKDSDARLMETMNKLLAEA